MFTNAKTGKRPSIEIECTLPEPAKGARQSRAAAVPRVARRLALAIRLQKLIDGGEATSDTVLEGIAGASRTRVSQVMALLNLSPDLQESILFLKSDPLREKDLREIAREVDWTKQRKLWCDLVEARAKS